MTPETSHRFGLYDRDGSYAADVDRAIAPTGRRVLKTPARTPQANACIEHVPRSHRYRTTPLGAQVTVFYTLGSTPVACAPLFHCDRPVTTASDARSSARTTRSPTSFRRSTLRPENLDSITHNPFVQDF